MAIKKPIDKVELLARVCSVLRLKHEIDHRKARENELIEVSRQLEAANQMLLQLSFSDALTGVANRRSLEKHAEEDNTEEIQRQLKEFSSYLDTLHVVYLHRRVSNV